MKIIEQQTTPAFKPVTIMFETPEELQYVTKLLSMGGTTLYKKFTGDKLAEGDPSYRMYCSLLDECSKQRIETGNIHNNYISE